MVTLAMKLIVRALTPNLNATSLSTPTKQQFTAARRDVFHRVGDVMESRSVPMEAMSPAALRLQPR